MVCKWGKVLFNKYAKPGMFGLDVALKESLLVNSTHFNPVFKIRLVPGNVVMAGNGTYLIRAPFGRGWG